MNATRIVCVPMVIAVLLLCSGCINLDTPHVPLQTHAIVIDFTAEDLSAGSEMPMYTYHVPGSQVIVSGHQGGGTSIGLVNGIVAVSGDSRGAFHDRMAVKTFEEALHISLASLAPHELSTLLDSAQLSQKFTLQPDASAPTLSIAGDVVLMFETDALVRPYVILHAKLTPPLGRGLTWSLRYAASLGAARSLSGPDGWASDGGTLLKSTVADELQRVLAVLLRDVSSPFARDRNSKFTVQGHFPFMKHRMQLVGYLLGEDASAIYFLPNMPSTSLLATVNIMEKSAITVRAATGDDPRIKIANGQDDDN
jgi:hypothetical protein